MHALSGKSDTCACVCGAWGRCEGALCICQKFGPKHYGLVFGAVVVIDYRASTYLDGLFLEGKGLPKFLKSLFVDFHSSLLSLSSLPLLSGRKQLL